MTESQREAEEDRRRAPERRRASQDRRRGMGPVMNDRRTRFSIFYFFVVLLFLFGVNYLLARADTRQIAYSEMKQRIVAGEIESVVIAGEVIRAAVRDTLQGVEGRPDEWRAVRVPDDQEFVPLLEAHGIEYSATARGWFGQALGWLLPVTLLIIFWFWMLRRMQPGAQGVMTIGRNRARIIGEEGTDVRFDDVAGADEAKQELVEVVSFLRTPEKFARLGAKIPKGVLVVGSPGTGKTLLARAVAGEAGVTFFSISGSEFVEMFVGVGASRVRDLFEQAKNNAPCIVFIDELDALGKARGTGGPMGGHDEREQTLNQLLVEMDGFDPRRGVIIMAATNRPEILDPALLRPGRFDRQVVVDRPDRQGREAILRVHAAGISLADEVDLALVARRTPGFVGADLANLLNEAALLAARRDSDVVTMEDIDDAIDRIVAGLEKRNRLVQDREREIVAYHEAGHAIIAERVEFADPVHKISIIPRGVAALGFTQQLPDEDRYLMQRAELNDRIAVLLAGRAAEELVYGEISSGAGNDIERATDIARRMVAELGMSEELGPVSFQRQRSTFLPSDDGARGQYSESTARTIDAEVRRILNESYARARELLRRDRAALDALARLLLEQEVVERAELRALLHTVTGRAGRRAGDDAATGREVGHVPDTAPARASRTAAEAGND